MISKIETKLKTGWAHFIFRITWYRFERQNATNSNEYELLLCCISFDVFFFIFNEKQPGIICCDMHNKTTTKNEMFRMQATLHSQSNPNHNFECRSSVPFRPFLEILFIMSIIELCPFLISHLSSSFRFWFLKLKFKFWFFHFIMDGLHFSGLFWTEIGNHGILKKVIRFGIRHVWQVSTDRNDFYVNCKCQFVRP